VKMSKKRQRRGQDEEDAFDDFFMEEDAPSKPKKSKKKVAFASNGDDKQSDDSSVAGSESEEEEVEETADEKRVRMAKAFLDKMKTVEASDDEDEDNEDDEKLDQRLRDEHLKAQGKYIQHVAEDLDIPNATVVQTLRGQHRLSVTALSVSQDDKIVFSASKDGNICQFDVETGKRVRTFKRTDNVAEGHTGEVMALAYHDVNPSILSSGGKDKAVRIWDIRVSSSEGEVSNSLSARGFGRYKHSGTITGLKFRNAEHLELLSVSNDRQLKIWNCTAMAYIDTLFGHQAEITCLDSLPSSPESALSCSVDGSVRFWKIAEESQLVFQDNHKMGNLPIDSCFMVNQNNFLSGGQDGILNLWSRTKKRPVCQIKGAHSTDSEAWISSVAAGRFSDIAASGSNRGSVKFWKLGGLRSSKDNIANALISLGEVQIHGHINALAFGNAHNSLLFAGVGRDHRFGRWEAVPGAKNSVQIVRLKSN
jgi:ribosomal RNA-processing protein 9